MIEDQVLEKSGAERFSNDRGSKAIKFAALIALSTLLSVTTVVFGGLPLLPARRGSPRSLFWGVQLLIAIAVTAAGFPFYGLVILAQTLLIGVYVEIEEHGSGAFTAGIVSILAAVGTVAFTGGLWLKVAKLQLGELLRQQIDPLIAQIASNSAPGSKGILSTAAVMQQLPSAVVIALILSLAVALITERKVAAALRLRHYKSGSKENLRAFRLPDAVVWVVVAAIAGGFLRHGKPVIELISVNVLNLLVVLYFFQGLAVVSAAFRTFKVSTFWKSVWYVLLVLQLFLMVSLIGFADYWLDFRYRLTSKPAESNS